MAPSATSPSIARPGAPTARKADRRTELDELRMEVRAAGLDMQSIAGRIHDAVVGGHLATVEHEAGRLWTLGRGYAAR